jgi:hypothetical protein
MVEAMHGVASKISNYRDYIRAMITLSEAAFGSLASTRSPRLMPVDISGRANPAVESHLKIRGVSIMLNALDTRTNLGTYVQSRHDRNAAQNVGPFSSER